MVFHIMLAADFEPENPASSQDEWNVEKLKIPP